MIVRVLDGRTYHQGAQVIRDDPTVVEKHIPRHTRYNRTVDTSDEKIVGRRITTPNMFEPIERTC